MKFPSLPEIFQRLLETLTSTEYELRKAALTALSRLRGDAAAEILFDRFKSDNLDDYLTYALSRMSADKSAKLFLQALHDSQVEIRIAAADALSRLNADEAIQVLSDAVEQYLAGASGGAEAVLLSEEAISGAVRALGRLGTPICLALLRKLLMKESNPRLRATILAAIIPRMSEPMKTLITGFLKDDDPRVRANAIEALQALKNPAVIAVLQPYLYDPHQRVRANAIKAIWEYGDFEVSATLKEMLADKDKRQRVSAIYAIGECRLGGFQKHVLAALKDGDADIRRNALIAIRKMSAGAQSPALAAMAESIQPLIDDQEPAVRLQAVSALEATMGAECYMPLVKRLLMENAAGVLAQIIETIGKCDKPETLSIIDSYLDNSEAQVAIAVLNVIGGIEPAGVTSVILGSVRRGMKHADVRVRRKTVETLWKLGATEVLDQVCAGLRHESQDVRKVFLQCFGEVCSEVSRSGGELLGIFENELKGAVAGHRKKLEQSRSSAVEADSQKLWNVAAGHIRAGRNGEAVIALEQLLKLVPRHVQALMALGDLVHRDGDHSRAVECFRAALALEPNLPKALYALGQIHHAKGEWREAAESLHTAIRLYPKLPQAYLLLAESLEELQRPQDAYKALLRLVELVPDNPAVLQRLARAAFYVGDSTKAVEAAKKAAAHGQIDLVCHFIIAYGMEREGNGGSAYRDLVVLTSKILAQPAGKASAELQKLCQCAVKLLAARSGKA